MFCNNVRFKTYESIEDSLVEINTLLDQLRNEYRRFPYAKVSKKGRDLAELNIHVARRGFIINVSIHKKNEGSEFDLNFRSSAFQYLCFTFLMSLIIITLVYNEPQTSPAMLIMFFFIGTYIFHYMKAKTICKIIENHFRANKKWGQSKEIVKPDFCNLELRSARRGCKKGC